MRDSVVYPFEFPVVLSIIILHSVTGPKVSKKLFNVASSALVCSREKINVRINCEVRTRNKRIVDFLNSLTFQLIPPTKMRLGDGALVI